MVLAHIGVAVFVVGVTLVKGYESEQDVRMQPGETVELAGYVFRLDEVVDGARARTTPRRARTVTVTRDGKPVTSALSRAARTTRVQDQVDDRGGDRPGLDARPVRLARRPARAAAPGCVKVQHKPFIDWIWGGCLIMALGGLLAASDRRYRFAAAQAKLRCEVTA